MNLARETTYNFARHGSQKRLPTARYFLFAFVFSLALTPVVAAQNQPSAPSESGFAYEKRLPLTILKDQAAIWTSPVHVKAKSLVYLVPIGVASAITAYYDGNIMNSLGPDANRERISGYVSHAGTLPVNFGIATGSYAIGKLTKNSYLANTGLLAVEALTDTTIITGIAKVSADRKRAIDGGDGSFLNGGHSFFSGHASLSFTTATVFATRYPHNPWVKYPAYALATVVSVSRVTARRHYVSDVLVGGTIGFLIGRYVTERHSGEFLSRVNFTPISNQRTQTFGLRVSFTGF